MNLEKLIKERRTIHDYKPEKVDWKIIEKALDLSLWSLNHKLTFPWTFFRVGPEARQKIADVMVEVTEAKKGPLSEVMKKSVRAKVLNPAELIFLGVKRSGNAAQEEEDYATMACSVQIASLYLWEQGVGSKWSTGGWVFKEKTAEALGVDTGAIKIVGCFLVGIGEHIPRTPERPPLKQFLIETT